MRILFYFMKLPEYKKLLGEPHVPYSLSPQEILVRYRSLLHAFSILEGRSSNRDVHDDNSYHYVPFPTARFIDILIEGCVILGADEKKKFLDVGCGIGLTVLLASTMFDAQGFDYNKELVEKANLLVGDSVFFGDANTFDRFGDYDFIYFYRPFFQDEQQSTFEQRVFEQMKPGAIVCPIWDSFDWPKHTKKVGQYFYQK